MTGHSGRIAKGLLVSLAIAAVSFGVSMGLQLAVGRLVSRFYWLLAPPRWWWYSPVPWPHTILAGALFAVVAFVLAWLGLRNGVALRDLVCGVLIGVAVAWGWEDLHRLGALDFFRAAENLRWLSLTLRSVHLSGAAGCAAGVVVAVLASRRRAASMARGQHLTSAST